MIMGIWLVVSTPLKNSQLGLFFPIYGKRKNVPNHQPGIYIYIVWMNHRISLTWTKAISLKKGSTTPGRSLRQHSTRAKSQKSQKQLATKEPFGSDPFHGQLCLIDSKLPSSLCHFLLSPNTVDTRSCRKSISLPAAH